MESGWVCAQHAIKTGVFVVAEGTAGHEVAGVSVSTSSQVSTVMEAFKSLPVPFSLETKSELGHMPFETKKQ